MHPNPVFRGVDDAVNLAFARDRGFGTLSVNGANGPLMAHVPLVLDENADLAELHLMRSNPIAAALTQPLPAVIALSGPDGYVSPDWYGIDDQVPTWNYVAVHLRGQLEPLPDADLRGILDRLSVQFEARLAPKPAWLAAKMDKAALARMMRMIRPARLLIECVDATWKLGQNKPDTARLAAAGHVTEGTGHELADLAALMRAGGPS